MDYSPPGSSVHGISQARILEWVAISISRVSFQPRGQISVFWLTGGFFITDWAAREDRYWYMDTIDITLLSDKWLANIFCHSVSYHFTPLMVSFDVQNVRIWIKDNLSTFSFVAYVFGVTSMNPLLNSRSWRTPLFSSKNVIVSSLTFKCLIHFEFIFVYGVRQGFKFIFLLAL